METNGVDKKGARGGRDRGSSRDPRVVYTPSPAATPEAEIGALVAAYRFLLDRGGEQPPTPPGNDGSMKHEDGRG